jgi:charged multivesicular body protein 3
MKKFFARFDLFGEKGAQERMSNDKDATPKGLCREWTRNLKREIRKVDRDIEGMGRSEKTTIAEIKKLAEKKEFGAMRILAKEIVRHRKAKDRLILTKTQLNSVSNQLAQQMAMTKIGSVFEKSADIMASMNKLMNVNEIHEMMVQMGKEMESAGLIEAVIGEGIDQALGDTVETEEQTQHEINKLFEELAIDAITLLPSAGKEGIRGQKLSTNTRTAVAAASGSPP